MKPSAVGFRLAALLAKANKQAASLSESGSTKPARNWLLPSRVPLLLRH